METTTSKEKSWIVLKKRCVNAHVLVFSGRLTCPEMAVCVSGNAAAVYLKTINILLMWVASPRRLARAIAQMMVCVRTLAPQPSEFYDLVSREAGEPFRSRLSSHARSRFQDGSADGHLQARVLLSQ